MSKLVEEIEKALKPHPVEGFCAYCYPMPTHQQVKDLIAEVERLTDVVQQIHNFTMNRCHSSQDLHRIHQLCDQTLNHEV